jgi:hypothetical protein
MIIPCLTILKGYLPMGIGKFTRNRGIARVEHHDQKKSDPIVEYEFKGERIKRVVYLHPPGALGVFFPEKRGVG